MSQTIKFFTLSLLLAAMLAGCGEAAPAVDTTVADTQTTTTAETVILAPDLPSITYGGAEIRFLTRASTDTVVRYYSEVASHEQNGETMNDSTYARTIRLEEKYDVKFVEDRVDDVNDTFSRAFLAGEDNWEVIVSGYQKTAQLAVADNYFLDLASLPYVDIEKPWWDTRVTTDLSIGGQSLVAVGAINTWTDSHTYAVVFNKDLAEVQKVDPYAMVDENRWTLDNFAKLLSDVTADIDGNSLMDQNDRYGAVGEYFNFTVHMNGLGVHTVTKDADDMPVYNVDGRFYDAAEKVWALLRSGDVLMANDYTSVDKDPWTNVIRKNFRAGNSLFYVGGIEQLLIFRDLDTPIGLLPMPKADENADYAHIFNTTWASVIAVPASNTREEMTGVLLEAMNADAWQSTAVDYYDIVIKGKAMRDKDSVRMLDIIRATRTADFEHAFGFLGLTGIYNSALKGKDSSALASSVASAIDAANAKLSDTLKNLS